MRIWTSFLCLLLSFLFLSGIAHAQKKKYLVSPSQEVIPLSKGESAAQVSEFMKSFSRKASASCSEDITYGFDPEKFPFTDNFGFYHRNVCGQWFTIPADGNIDTVFFHTYNQVGPGPEKPGSMDSTIYFRIFTSYLDETHGPGVSPEYRPPCTSWGYWVNTNDNDQGVAAFREDASDTTWIPTNLVMGDAVESFPPFGNSIWGLNGFPIDKVRPNSIIKVAMEDLQPLTVRAGDHIFVSFRIPSVQHLDEATQDIRFEIWASSLNVPYPPRDWKFYEHDSGPSPYCSGTPAEKIKRGWVARGVLDTTRGKSSAYDIWYMLAPTSNTAPVVSSVEQVHTTTSTEPQVLSAIIYDCDAENPGRAGVAEALVRYHFDDDTIWSAMPMSGILDQFSAELPGVQQFHSMTYRIVARDSTGAADSSATYSYRVVNLNSAGWYRCDTTEAPTPANIAGTGTAIDTSAWFIDPRAWVNTTNLPHRGDDGTAGPFAISGGFPYYGDTMNYVWIGVNGAIALSKWANDTIDVNYGGYGGVTGGVPFDFPENQHHSRADTLHDNSIPKAFIAPYYADWVTKQDSPLATFGHVRYQDDANKFVAEWDSIGAFFDVGAQPDIAAFRVVLNKTDNTVEFQYDEIGTAGLDTLNVTGIQCDSNYHAVPPGEYPPYNYFNIARYPSETRLHNGLNVRFVPVAVSYSAAEGWNMFSLPTSYVNHEKAFLYPTAVSAAFIYQGGYVVTTTLNNGPGFWLKFGGAQTVENIGRSLASCDITIANGWNMIGSIGSPVPTSAIAADQGTGINSLTTYFGYAGSYFPASTIQPGFGYWVRATGPGQIHLTAAAAPKVTGPVADLANMSKITIGDKSKTSQVLYIGTGSFDPDKYQMPPRGPEGTLDARFASGRMVETYPTVLDPATKYSYPIAISASQYPVTISWSASRTDEGHTLTLKTEDGKILAVMAGNGKVTLNDASVKRVEVTVAEGVALPKVFALSRNYPNPFNPTTRFTVELPQTAQVDVSVYDVLGRKIATLMTGDQTAGYHTIEWDSHDSQGMTVPSGIYFIRMNVPSEQFSAVQKAMLVK